MSVVVLDTHTLVWWLMTPSQLGKAAAKTLSAADSMIVSSVSFWEIAMLARKGRIELGRDTDSWMAKVVRIPRLHVHDLDWSTATLADSLSMHADPADRFIAATTLQNRTVLVTKDALLRELSFIKTVW
jgi:PIN domain nuclease of toxin-antitoxin system